MVRSIKGISLPMALIVGALMALAAWAALVGPAQAQEVGVELKVGTVEAKAGATGEVGVTIAINGVEATVKDWDLAVTYDPAVITVSSCTGGEVTSAGTIAITGTDAVGVSEATLATCSFTAVAAAGTCTDMNLTVNSLTSITTPENVVLVPSATAGEVCIVAADPVAVPQTGGAPTSGGNTDSTLWLLTAGLVVMLAGGGAWVLARAGREN